MFFKRLFTPGLAINTYLLGDQKTKKCVVIDPTRHVVPVIMQAQNAELDIVAILETHVHADYVSGAKELKHQLNEKPQIYASGLGGEEWIPRYVDVVVKKGAFIRFGDLRLEALHTPGHTPEHVSWVCYDESRSSTTPWFVFTGDALFVGGIGRPDLLGQEEMVKLAPLLYRTVFDVFALMPDFVEIFPAHGEGSFCGKFLQSRPCSTIGYEKRFNICFQKKPIGEWIHLIQKDLPTPPDYFQRLKKVNIEGPLLINQLKTKIWTKEEGVSVKELFLVDVRHPEIFAPSHILGSLNIPFAHAFCQWAGWMLPSETPIGLILEQSYVYTEVVDQLRLMGFDQDIWIIQLGDNPREYPFEFEAFPVLEIDEIAEKKDCYILDVRTQDEWKAGHIPQSHHLELNRLEKEIGNLPSHQSIALLCRSGLRASIAASLLKKHGFSSVMNIRGGIQAWKLAGLPIQEV